MKLALLAAAALTAALALGRVQAATSDASGIQTTSSAHMQMTLHGTEQPGDRARADAIVAAAQKVMAEYPTAAGAEKAGFTKFIPKVPLPIEHYVNKEYAREAWIGEFDPLRPTALIFKRDGSTLHIVGVMYTAANSADRDALDSRVPLSYGTWHRHIDFCKPPAQTALSDRFGASARFGFQGSIMTKDACEKAGGTFIPIVFGWMVHVWPNEKTRAAIWAVDAHDSMSAHDEM